MHEIAPEFVHLLESLPDGSLIVDANGRIAFASERLARMFGYASDELLGQAVEILVPRAVRARHQSQREPYQAAPHTRPMGQGIDLEGQRKDGSTFPVEISLSAHLNSTGHITAIVTDISARKNIERRVRLQQSLAAILAETQSLREGARLFLASVCRECGWDVGGLAVVNHQGLKLTPVADWQVDDSGRDRLSEVVLSQVLSNGGCGHGLIWQTSRYLWITDIAREPASPLQQAGAVGSLASALLCPIGTDEVVAVVAFASTQRREPDEFAISVLEDAGRQFGQFAHRKRNEAELKTSESRFREMFDRAPFGICLVSGDRRVLDANPAFLRLLEYPGLEDLRTQDLSTKVFASPDDCRRLFRENDLRSAGTMECEWKTRSGRPIHVRLSAIPERDSWGGLRAVEVFVEDLTDRRRLEEEYRHTTKMEALGQLASGVAHDFNNLLTVISVDSDMLLDRIPDDGATRLLVEEIDHTVERGADLVRRLLAFSRRQPETLKLAEIDAVIQACRPMLSVLTGESIHLNLELQCPGIYARVDTSEFEQVLMNLAVNARDAMESTGTLTIRTSLSEDDVRGPEICVDVKDTGSGIPPEVQARIFEPFFTTKEAGKGTGLGLFTVYGIVRQFGGRITCTSVEGQGAQFRVVLPAMRSGPAVDSLAPPAALGPPTGETILVVEDTETIRRSVRDILSRAGYQVLDAGTATAALEHARAHSGQIDLLLTDVGLPQMRGDELAKLLRAERPALKVIYMSGYSQTPSDQGIEGHYLPKPFKRQTLLTTVRDVLRSGTCHNA